MFFVDTVNNSVSDKSIRPDETIALYEKELKTMTGIAGVMPSEEYVKTIRSSICHLCPDG